MATVEMSFTPLPVHVRTARLVATAVARRSGVQEALLDEVRLAVGEACSRAVEAHRAHCPTEPVRIELTGTRGRFEVVVTDAAARDDDGALDHEGAHDHEGDSPAGPGAANGLPAPGSGSDTGYLGADGSLDDPEALLPQGLGLAVIAGLADDVKISRTAGGLSIRMSWPSGDYTG
jgi:serine/threonine-protein kinase RsbW